MPRDSDFRLEYNPFKELRINKDLKDITENDVRKAYLLMSKEFHPDRNGGSTERFQTLGKYRQDSERCLAHWSSYPRRALWPPGGGTPPKVATPPRHASPQRTTLFPLERERTPYVGGHMPEPELFRRPTYPEPAGRAPREDSSRRAREATEDRRGDHRRPAQGAAPPPRRYTAPMPEPIRRDNGAARPNVRYPAYSDMRGDNPRPNVNAANFSQVPHQENFRNYGSARTAGYRTTYTIVPQTAPQLPRRPAARQPPRTPAPPPPAPVRNWELDRTRSELGLAYYVDKYNGRQLVEFYSDPDRFSFSPSETRAGDIIDYVGEPDDILVLVGRRTGLKYSLIPFGPRWSVIISFNRRLYDIVNLKWFDRRNRAIRYEGKRLSDIVIDDLDRLLPLH